MCVYVCVCSSLKYVSFFFFFSVERVLRPRVGDEGKKRASCRMFVIGLQRTNNLLNVVSRKKGGEAENFSPFSCLVN